MYFSITKYVKNREIHEDDIRRLWNFFLTMTQEPICGKTGGTAGLTFKSDAYGEISGDSDDAIDEAMSRRKPIKEVVLRYRSKDLQSSMTLCLQDEFSGFFKFGHGGVFELEGSDRRWFDATIRRFEDMVETLPQTPRYSRFLCRSRWLVSAILSFGLSFGLIRVLCKGLTYWFGGGEYLEWVNRVSFILCGVFHGVFFFVFYNVILDFISKNYPVVDLELFKNRTNIRQRCSKFLWWLFSALGAAVIGMLLSSGEKKVNKDTGLPNTTTNDVQISRQPFPSANGIEKTR